MTRATEKAVDAGATAPVAEGGKRQLARGVASRKRLLEVATRMFLQKGYANTAVAEVVGEAGLPPTSLYYHFGNKQNLLAAVIEARGNWVREGYIVDTGASLYANIGLLVRHARAHVEEHVMGLRLRLILTFEDDEQLTELAISGRQRTLRGLAEKIADIDALADHSRRFQIAERVADAYLVGMQGICLDHLLRPRPAEELDRAFRHLESGLRRVARLELRTY